ncbi:MAG: putative toxin-antitoxin system toxin component, PIN family [Prochloraceae cyanobacterium]
MRRRPRIVPDTNVLISRLLIPSSIPAQAVRLAADEGDILISRAVLSELVEVIGRPKFDKYVSLADRKKFVRKLMTISQMVEIVRQVQVCRDAKDDMYLDVAINVQADFILTGDRDLLVLSPFMGVEILAPTDFLAAWNADND